MKLNHFHLEMHSFSQEMGGFIAGEEESENDLPRMNLGDKEDDSGERGKDGSPPPPTTPVKKGLKGRLERLAASPSVSFII